MKRKLGIRDVENTKTTGLEDEVEFDFAEAVEYVGIEKVPDIHVT